MDKETQIEEMYQEFLQHKHDTMCEVFSYKGMCENFINLGYRKINENEVVISKEEHESLAKLLIYDKPIKSRIYEFINDIKERTRKETAEKILKDIMFCIDINDCNKNEMLILNLCKMLAKQFGVEIKE